MSDNQDKEETLASFQNITNIEDVGEAFSHLEAANWDLVEALSRVIPQDDAPLANLSPNTNPIHHHPPEAIAQDAQVSPAAAVGAGTGAAHPNANLNTNLNAQQAANTNGFRPFNYDEMPGPSQGARMFPTSQLLAQLTSSINLDPSRQNNNQNILVFNIHFNQQIYQIRIQSLATVEQLKRKIFDVTNVPQCRQALRGWPPSRASEAQLSETQLCNLGLAPENELILVDLTDDGFMDTEQDESTQRLDKIFKLHIVVEPEGRRTTLSIEGKTTIEELKTKVYYITNTPVRHQEWSGWPSGCDNETTLAQSGIEQNHEFVVRNIADRVQNNSNALNSSDVVNLDSESSADEFEDATDFNNSEYIFTDSPPVQPLNRHLISNNTNDETSGSAQFVENYRARFGEPHADFFIGSLEDALRLACHKPAKERKLLAIYLHHGESILTNVFCDHLMKDEGIILTFRENFVLYGWDMTYESNKDMFLSSLTACINSNASLTARNIKLDKLPAIMLVGKSRMMGRQTCEVLSVIHGNIGLADLQSRLLDTTVMYEEQLQGEIREENERAARDLVKAEQDMAYEETLQADMAKEAAKRQKELAQAAERKRIESERAEEDARRESIRLVAKQSLPQEPAEHEANISKIRVRKPTGDHLERRFYTRDTLQDLLNFVAANGFLIDEYKVFSGWPRRDLTAIEASQTLESLKLYPQETVILEERF
ncbi:FAS-associated factor 1 isoform X1 [Drosophila nasuta]|uniref:FAS-associated factor 1 isoform X1 n=1 Tax=Drosophila nasuta TaxID=42062 RepID=UPI00295EA86E|nr:FAS-associated factor 1 isoform X1 [Drosophila nasuta]